MTKQEILDKLNSNGIYKLRRGESVKDALDYVDGNKDSRTGYDVKVNIKGGRNLDKNEQIIVSNKEAFMKFTPAEYNQETVKNIEDAIDGRENVSKRGILTNCYYCGCALRIDGEGGDYPGEIPEVHCERCMRDAISCLAM